MEKKKSGVEIWGSNFVESPESPFHGMNRDEILNHIKKHLIENLNNKFLGEPVAEETFRNTKEFILQQLCCVVDGAEINNIDIDVEAGKYRDIININSKNLFTLLLLNGIYVPRFILGDVTEWETEKGTFEFIENELVDDFGNVMSKNICSFRPKTPLKFVNLDITILKDGSVEFDQNI